jgi:PhnB protein
LYVKAVDAMVERAVRAGAKLVRPIENMFYGDRSGAVEDPFGYTWYISTHVENVSLGQIKKRTAQMFKQ